MPYWHQLWLVAYISLLWLNLFGTSKSKMIVTDSPQWGLGKVRRTDLFKNSTATRLSGARCIYCHRSMYFLQKYRHGFVHCRIRAQCCKARAPHTSYNVGAALCCDSIV